MNNIISTENVLLGLKDTPWEYDSSQLAACYHYDSTTTIPEELGLGYFCYGENKYELERDKEDETGYYYNDSSFWIHPIRSNQYRYTEIAPFPYIKFNETVGNSWSSSKEIGEGWCELAGKTKEEYILKSKSIIKKGIKCYWVHATSIHPLGNSSVDFFFSKKRGLVLSKYQLLKGYKLDIILK